MHVLVDAFGVRPGSAAITLENLLRGWSELGTDSISVLTDTAPCFEVPPGALIQVVEPPLPGNAGQLWLRSVGLRRAARRLNADAVISGVPASGLVGTRCPAASSSTTYGTNYGPTSSACRADCRARCRGVGLRYGRCVVLHLLPHA